MPDVLLVTCDRWPDGEPEARHLDKALADAGISFRWVSWTDETVDWASARLVSVRSTWDYFEEGQHPRFLDWASRVAAQSLLLNGPEVFAWNTDKAYLVELAAAGVPVVPTRSIDVVDDLVAAAASFDGPVVIKPRVGGGGVGVVVVTDPDDVPDADVGPGPWAVQPVVEAIRTEGELSVYVFGGLPTYQVRKVPAEGTILVHEHFGGRTIPVPLDDDAVSLALTCVKATEGLLGRPLHYARVDQMRHEGELVVSELEATEPGLYLDVIPENAEAFTKLIAKLLKEIGPGD